MCEGVIKNFLHHQNRYDNSGIKHDSMSNTI